MSSELDRRIIIEADDGSRIEAYLNVVGRGPDGSFMSPDEVRDRVNGIGYGLGSYGQKGYGQ